MEVSNKTNKPLSIISGVLIALTALANIISNLSYAGSYGVESGILLMNIVQVVVPAILLAVALFRGKKDKVGGILVVITAAFVLLNGLIGVIGQLGGMYRGFSVFVLILFSLATSVCNAAIRGGIAMECFNPGKISGSKLKLVLMLVPAVTAILLTLSQIVQTVAMGYSGAEIIGTAFGGLIGNVFAMGILEMAVLAFVLPVKKTPAETFAQPVYQQPAYQQPAYQQPAYQQPVYQQPVYQQPVYQQPTYQQSVYQQPAYQQPTYQQPAYQQPAYQQPTYQQPTYQQPVRHDAAPVQMDVPFAPQDAVPVQLDIPFAPQDAAPVQMDAPVPPQNNQ